MDLAHHNCVVFKARLYGNVWRFMKGKERVDVPVNGNLYSETGPVLLSAATSGIGLVVLQEYMVRSALSEGSLRSVLSDYEVTPTTEADTALYAVYPHSHGLSPKSRAFVDFLVDLFRRRESHIDLRSSDS
jgi:DNA-binding transcriptional LysR family regulator